MKKIILFLILITVGSCQKVKKTSDYQRFIGMWINTPSTTEQTIVTFSENGKISIECPGERGIYFKPNSYTTQKSNDETLNLPWWDEFSFDEKIGSIKKVDGRTMTINLSNNSMYYSIKQINDFTADSMSTTLLIKL